MEAATKRTERVHQEEHSHFRQAYSPEQHIGKVFVTNHGSTYAVVAEGRFIGRKNINNARVDIIAGIDPIYRYSINEYFRLEDESGEPIDDDGLKGRKHQIDYFILAHGQAVREGLLLLLSLKEEDVLKTRRPGFMCSICKIY